MKRYANRRDPSDYQKGLYESRSEEVRWQCQRGDTPEQEV
jgi:hypothetical protein